MKTKAPLTTKQKSLLALFALLLLATGTTIAWDMLNNKTQTPPSFTAASDTPVNLRPSVQPLDEPQDTSSTLEAAPVTTTYAPVPAAPAPSKLILPLSDNASEALTLMEEEALLRLKARKQSAERQQLSEAQTLKALKTPQAVVQTQAEHVSDNPTIATRLEVRSITQTGKRSTAWLALDDEFIPATVGTRIMDVTVKAIHRNSVVLEEAGKRTTRYLKKPLLPEKEVDDANS
ncbi:hypothetical protein MD535_22315 [Vibrio sp. ZSDZ65]|uniref:Type IV pilus biogenesis protein PilP n=1 Tax=Vibrio qingdaonensis TaxID=2829491 RepID=A0A9X3HZD3_9VIBR|nr:hypothetical protein [Vibrio qingdaonensis]MCW8348727.1 hypothetical protein [Vibrio qingdaonensis]